jgi:Ca2+-binding EF-hand superfamily protein
MTDLHSRFELFDKDRDGYIAWEELAVIMRLMGCAPTERECREIADSTEDPMRISEAETKQIISDFKQEPDARAKLMEAFRVFDKDESGELYEN